MALVGAGLVALLVAGVTAAAAGTLSKTDQQCLGCHSQHFTKSMTDGETLSLHISGKAFARSVHDPLGCTGCHSNIDLGKHPQAGTKEVSLREHAIAFVKICRQCHEDKFKRYEGSIHAALVREGSSVAPLCTGCHNPHTMRANEAASGVAGAPCRKCHATIYTAYAGSVHGRAHAGGNAKAPTCFSCHGAHDIKAVVSGGQFKNTCLGCHKQALAAHEKWLPNAALHFQAVSCSACHVPHAARRVVLRIYDKVARLRVEKKQGVPQFATLARPADAGGQGVNALGLQGLLKEISREGGGNSILRGRLEVSNGVQAHQLVGGGEAIKDCNTCHRKGAAPFQTVLISVVGPDGRPLRYDAEKGILSSARSVDSIGGFYAIGGTRINFLDTLFVLALATGIGVPIGHMSLKWLFRRYREKSAEQVASRPPEEASQPLPGDGSDKADS